MQELTYDWVDVNDLTPSDDREVLVFAPNCNLIGKKLIGRYFSDTKTWTVYDFGGSKLAEVVTHWMELPLDPGDSRRKFPGVSVEGSAMYWLKMAHDKGFKWAEQALYNSKHHSIDTSGCLSNSMSQMLSLEFLWEATQEGYSYWGTVYDALKDLEFDNHMYTDKYPTQRSQL